MAAVDEDLVSDTPSLDVIVCVTTYRRETYAHMTDILRSFWDCGIQCALVKSNTFEEGLELSHTIGGIYYVFYGNYGLFRLRSRINDEFKDLTLKCNELITHVKSILRTKSSVDPSPVLQPTESATVSRVRGKICPFEFNFLTLERTTPSMRRFYQSALFRSIALRLPTLMDGNKRLFFVTINLPLSVLHAVFDPDAIALIDVSFVTAQYPKYAQNIVDLVADITRINSICLMPIVCLYSLRYKYFRFITNGIILDDSHVY